MTTQRSLIVLILLLIPCSKAMATQTYGDWWVRNNPFYLAGTVDNISTNTGTVATYTNTWNATGVDVFPSGADHITNWYEPNQVPWVLWVTPAAEGTDGVFQPYELRVNPNLPHRVGYHIGGEPKNQQEINEVLATAAALKAYDPDGLVYAGINTDLGILQVQQYMSDPNIDLIMGHKYYLDDSTYVDLQRYRSLGLEHGKPYWRFMQSFFGHHQDYLFTESDFRFLGYSALTYGYTGLVWFVYNMESYQDLTPQMFVTSGTQLSFHRRTPQFEYVAGLNAEMAIIGDVTRQLRSTDVRLQLGASSGPVQPGVPAWSLGAGDDPFIRNIDQLVNDDMDILAGFFVSSANEIYFMLQNTLHTHGDIPSSAPGRVRVDFDFSTATSPNFDKTQIKRLSRTTGLWEAISLVSDGGDQYHADLTLSAGSADLFRYSIAVLSGDFNADNVVDDQDIDILRKAIALMNPDDQFDLNGDSILDNRDVNFLLTDILDTSIADVTLDHIVDANDLAIVRANMDTSSTGITPWSHGNIVGDNAINGVDLLLLRLHFGYENLPAPSPAVPEPTSLGLMLSLIPLSLRRA